MDAVEAIFEQLYIANVIRVASLTEDRALRGRRVDLAWTALEHTAPEDHPWRPNPEDLA